MSQKAAYLTAEEVAAMYRLTVSALYTQRHRREAPGSLAVKVGRKLLWRQSELDAWFDRTREEAALSRG